MDRLAHEPYASRIRSQRLVAKDVGAAGRRESIVVERVVESVGCPTRRIDTRREWRIGQVDNRRESGNERIPLQVAVVDHEMPHRPTVLVAEPVPPIVATAAPLALSAHTLDAAFVRPESHISARHGRGFACFSGGNRFGVFTAGRVEPIYRVRNIAYWVDSRDSTWH